MTTDSYLSRLLRVSGRALTLLTSDIPYRTMLSEHDVLTRRGTLVRMWRLGDQCTQLVSSHGNHHDTWPAALTPANSGQYALWLHRLGEPVDPAARRTWAQCANTLYLSLVYWPNAGRVRRSSTLTRVPASRVYSQQLHVMCDASAALMQHLAPLQPHLLGDYFSDGQHRNEVFDLLSYLVNGVWSQRAVLASPLYRTLPNTRPDAAGPCQPVLARRFSRHPLCPFPEHFSGQLLCASA